MVGGGRHKDKEKNAAPQKKTNYVMMRMNTKK
jgi:hypothetical protein